MHGRLFLLRILNNCDLEIQLGNFNLQTCADDHSNNNCDASSHFFRVAKISNEVGFLVLNVSKDLKDKWSVSKLGLALQRTYQRTIPIPTAGATCLRVSVMDGEYVSSANSISRLSRSFCSF